MTMDDCHENQLTDDKKQSNISCNMIKPVGCDVEKEKGTQRDTTNIKKQVASGGGGKRDRARAIALVVIVQVASRAIIV